MMVTVFAQTDKIMIKMFVGDAENGYYSTAVTCAGITGFVFGAVVDSLRPVIFESKKVSQKDFEKNVTLLYSIIFYMGMIQSVFLTVFAKQVVDILYGPAYLAAIPLLQIITWYSAFSYMGTVRNIWMLAEEKQKYLWILNMSGALLNVVGNLTQFFTNFLLCFIVRPIRPTSKLIIKALNPKPLFDMLMRKKI